MYFIDFVTSDDLNNSYISSSGSLDQRGRTMLLQVWQKYLRLRTASWTYSIPDSDSAMSLDTTENNTLRWERRYFEWMRLEPTLEI